MMEAISHRGPEGGQSWQGENGIVHLGHRRLSIIDLSEQAAQPMHYQDRFTIIHNGEIYNYRELKAELTRAGYQFRTHSDTEVITASYSHWGEECLGHFDGMFAFAIWDNKEKELFAARDRFGEKPFYYFFDGRSFLFASEMKAMWAAGIPRQPNLQLLFNFITIGYVDNPEKPEETFYQGIERLPPASKLFYNPFSCELTIERYWDLETRVTKRRIPDAEAVDEFTALFAASVKKRLRSDVPIGTSLSGGIDSSAVVAMMRECEPALATSKAFTSIFPGFEKDESRHSKMIAEHFDLKQYTVSPTSEDLLNDWDLLCHHQEEPFGSASTYAQFRTYKLAKDNGVTVLLDGQGADEILAGYHRYYKWYWQELFIKRKLLKSGEIRAARKLGIQESFGIKNIVASLFPDLASVILEKQYLVKALQHEDLSVDFVKQQSREAYYATPDYFNLNGALYFNACVHGLEELLRYADRNSMAHGREVRLPFLNHELAEFVFSLPSHFKIRKGWTKWLLRTSMHGSLPAAITWRKDKVGFEPPQKEWMENPKWKEFIIEARKKLVSKGILKNKVIDKPLIALGSHEADNFDWRYLSAAAYL